MGSGFLTTAPNAVIEPFPSEGDAGDPDDRRRAGRVVRANQAKALQRPLPDDALQVVRRGADKEDMVVAHPLCRVHGTIPGSYEVILQRGELCGGCAGTARSLSPLPSMKIRAHSESHLVELDDGSKWQIFPGDLDVTLNWQPDTELKLVRIDDPASSHALVSGDDNSSVRVLPAGEKWPVDQVRTVLKDNS